MSISTPSTSAGKVTDTMEKTIGMVTMSDPGTSSGKGGQLPIISTVYSMSTVEDIEDPGEEEAPELEVVSSVTQNLTPYDSKECLSGSDLRIKREMVDDDLQPGDLGFYPSLQYIYRNLQHAERAVNVSKDTSHHTKNLMRCNGIIQILEMKTSHSLHAQCTGKDLPEGWDTVGLQERISSSGARGMDISDPA